MDQYRQGRSAPRITCPARVRKLSLVLYESTSSTVYAITDQRAIVINGGLFGGIQVYSYEPDRLTGIERNQRADGSGDLVLESFVQGTGSGASTVRRGFMAITNVKEASLR